MSAPNLQGRFVFKIGTKNGVNEVLSAVDVREFRNVCVVCWYNGTLKCRFQLLSQGLISGPQNATLGNPNVVL